MKIFKLFGVVAFIFFLSLFLSNVKAYPIFAITDKIIYLIGDTLTVKGTVDTTAQVTISATIYNSTGSVMNSSFTLSSGSTPNTFSISNLIDSSYSPGDYFVIISDGTDTVNISFKVFSELVILEPHLIGSAQVISVDTSTRLDNITNSDYGEIVNLSKNVTKAAFNGSADIGGKTYYFIVVDEKLAGSHDTIYIDDDQTFQLYNATEDSANEFEKIKRIGEGVRLNNTDFIISYIEFPTGKKVLLTRLINDTIYSPGETVNFAVLAKNSTGHLLSDQDLDIRLLNSAGIEINSTIGATNQFGYFSSNFTAPSQPGVYTINVNNSLGLEFFSVEAFSLIGKITDLTGNPMYTFAPNPDVRITAILRNSTGAPVETATIYATINFPDGTINTYTLTGGNGTWSYDLSLKGAPIGGYGVKITATVDGNKQEFLTGFAIESAILDVIPINVEFLEESGGKEALVNTFSPGKNVTLLVLLSNASAGGIFAKGPEGLVDIDNPSTAQDECNTTLAITKLEDDRGISWLDAISYRAMNLTNAVSYFGKTGEIEGIPPMLLRQCMIVFPAPNRTGVYRVEVKVSHVLGEVYSGSTFGVQRLYATANPVDFKGEDFWFYAPDSTIRIRIKIIDLATRQEVPSVNITDARILEMFREWPTFQDVLADAYKPNENITNGTLIFITPDTEGFFRFTFKFKVDLAGIIEEGVGTGFFMLKKYFIWGEPVCAKQVGPCIFSSGQNITIRVTVVDVSEGIYFGSGKSLSCSGADGLEIDVQSLVNHQVFKELIKNTDYSVKKGSILNCTGEINITVNPSRPLPSGWYGVELLLRDKSVTPNKEYFGWAGFEVRNFWVETIPIFAKDGNLIASWWWQPYGVNQPVVFTVIARDPTLPFESNMLPISKVEVESVRWIQTWPPLDIPFTAEVSQKPVIFEFGPDGGQPINAWVVNITSGSSKQGPHQADVKVITEKGSDVGTYWFDVASYFVKLYYRGMYTWPPVYASNENLTINVSAFEFDGTPHNLSTTGTKIRSVWDIKTGRALKLNSSTTCNQNNCTITANLSSLVSGEYDASIEINDTQGNEKEEHVYFVIRALTIAIPTIEEAWIGYSDTPDRELNVDNDRDFCDNERLLQWNGTHANGTFEINVRGEWGYCPPEMNCPRVLVIHNTSHLWILNETTGQSMIIPPGPLVKGDNFTVNGDLIPRNWTVVSLNVTTEPWFFHVRHNESKICGSYWEWVCTKESCQSIEKGYVITPPSNYTTFYHGYIRNLVQNLEWDQWFVQWFGQDFNLSRPTYVYHNTTHIWLTNTTDFTGKNPAGVNLTVTDSYDGMWKIKSIYKNKVELVGQNVLARTGAWINTSLSKSGTIKIEPKSEKYFGGWDPITSSWRGIDLDGDGLTNSTIYFAIVDSSSAGLYDRFFFSDDANLSKYHPNGILVSDPNRANREFGNADKLTLLSIAPDANRIKFYSNKTGEWADFGELELGGNITIPVIVRSPSDTPETANVSIRTIRKEVAFGPSQIIQLQPPYPNVTNCNGLCEIVVNVSRLNPPQTDSGRYAFEILASKVGVEERLEEWKWPHVMLRIFLVESSVGEGGYVGEFKPLPIWRDDWENYPRIPELATVVNLYGKDYTAVFAGDEGEGIPISDLSACHFDIETANKNETNATYKHYALNNPQYYFYINAGNMSKLWIKVGDCNFTAAAGGIVKNVGDGIDIEVDGRIYKLAVLEANATQNEKRFVIGIRETDFNSTAVKPIVIREWAGAPSPRWRLMAANISNVNYQIILANASVDYPMCSVWNVEECAKIAWISTTGNFSAVEPYNIQTGYPVLIGQNFTSDLYLAKIGPGPWEGIIIANSSLINVRPGLDVRIRDGTTPRFAILNETVLNLDLNKDNDKNDQFYMVTFDDREDGLQNPTANIVDDDLNITEEWYQNFTATGDYKDFYGNEFGQKEFREPLPTAKWYGGARFNETMESVSWEYEPRWDVLNFNDTHALLRKWRWQFNVTENVTIILKAYNFDQTPVANANVSFLYMIQFTPFGGLFINGTSFQASGGKIVNVQNVTDSKGFAILRLENSTWEQADYMAVLTIKSTAGTETVHNWFRVGISPTLSPVPPKPTGV